MARCGEAREVRAVSVVVGSSVEAAAEALGALRGSQARAARRYGLRAWAAGERGDWRAYSCWAALCDAAMAD